MSVISTLNYTIYIDEDFSILKDYISSTNPSSVVVLTDDNTLQDCLPVLDKYIALEYLNISVPAGEQNKNIETCNFLWKKLLDLGTDRSSLIVNLGGGVLGDIGGFVASTYKRGIRFINIPTTLLSQVDASIGGKTGIDFQGQKNMIGLFNNPEMVFIHSEFLKTLDRNEFRSGYAEIIKHGLIQSPQLWQHLLNIGFPAPSENISSLIEACLMLKNKVVAKDPREKGIRKILNFGHTIGHAIESHFLQSGNIIRHGEAVAAGMICESFISYHTTGLKLTTLGQITNYLKSIYPVISGISEHGETILEYCRKDKKNIGDTLLFSLLEDVGACTYNSEVSEELILNALEYYNNNME